MLVRLGCSLALAIVVLAPVGARADCAQEISQLMSKDTEKLTTRFNRISKKIQSDGASPRLLAEECRIARALEPRLVKPTRGAQAVGLHEGSAGGWHDRRHCAWP